MSGFTQVDLSKLPAPDVVEAVDYEAVLAALVADLRIRWPEFDALVESDAAVKLAEAVAYLKTLTDQRVNDAARAVLLATATGGDLDHIAANFSVERLVVDPGDAEAIPPIPPVFEADDGLRRRVQLALEAATAAGTKGRYLFYTLGASGLVADASISAHDPIEGEITITVLSADENDWTPDAALIAAVDTVVQDEEVRQLCDTVHVEAATLINYAIDATVTYLPGAGAETAEALATERVNALIAGRRLGRDVTRSALFAALHVEGVHNVVLTAPAADVVVTEKQAARCTGVTLTNGGVDE